MPTELVNAFVEKQEDFIKTAIASFNYEEAVLTAIADECCHLTIKGEFDREGYEQVQSARKKLSKVITGIEHKRKEIVAFPVRFNRDVNAYAKKLSGIIEPTRDALLLDENAFECAEADRVRIAKEQKAIAYQSRITQILDTGARLVNDLYTLGNVTMHPISVETADDNAFELLLGGFNSEKMRLIAVAAEEKAREEREKAVARELAEKQRKENETEKARLLKENAEFLLAKAKLEAEQKALDTRRIEAEKVIAEAKRIEDVQKALDTQRIEAERLEVQRLERIEAQAANIRVVDPIEEMPLHPEKTKVRVHCGQYHWDIIHAIELTLERALSAKDEDEFYVCLAEVVEIINKG